MTLRHEWDNCVNTYAHVEAIADDRSQAING